MLDIEKHQQQHQHSIINNSLSTTSGGYVCSTSSDSSKHNSQILQKHQVRVLSPPSMGQGSISRPSAVADGDDSSCIDKHISSQVTARKSSHKQSTITTESSSSSSFKRSNQQIKPDLGSDVHDMASPMASSTATTIDPNMLMTKTKYNRRNNPDLEKRRIHFCDHPGK